MCTYTPPYHTNNNNLPHEAHEIMALKGRELSSSCLLKLCNQPLKQGHKGTRTRCATTHGAQRCPSRANTRNVPGRANPWESRGCGVYTITVTYTIPTTSTFPKLFQYIQQCSCPPLGAVLHNHCVCTWCQCQRHRRKLVDVSTLHAIPDPTSCHQNKQGL